MADNSFKRKHKYKYNTILLLLVIKQAGIKPSRPNPKRDHCDSGAETRAFFLRTRPDGC